MNVMFSVPMHSPYGTVFTEDMLKRWAAQGIKLTYQEGDEPVREVTCIKAEGGRVHLALKEMEGGVPS